MTGRNLRDLKRNTEMLILVEILESPHAKLKDVAAKLDITVQAVSQYIAEMRKEGLVKEAVGKLKPSRRGMQMLQEHFTGIKHEVDGILRKIRVVDTCVAIAGADVKRGKSVGLTMEDGMLMAIPGRRSSSKGIALEDAREGDDVRIGALEGIVDLELGQLLVIETPSETEGGSKGVDVDRVREQIEKLSPGLLAAGDAVGASLLSKATEEMYTVHAPVESAMSAMSRGVDVVFCGTRESVDQLLSAVADLKKGTGYAISWKSFRA
ncbi:MAG: winged helix-turn-helix transcriptional regulator [Thermoplasmata archaeon]|nr:winged helix-turn-helix transcriptional regulator [Thermoplasmata archaeon]